MKSGMHQISMEMVNNIEEPYLDLKLHVWCTKKQFEEFDIFQFIESCGFQINGCDIDGTRGFQTDASKVK